MGARSSTGVAQYIAAGVCATHRDGSRPFGQNVLVNPSRMHEDEVPVDDATVRALLKEQFPEWADEPLRRIPDSGTDNAIYRLGEDMGIRLPRIRWAEAQIEKECRWLPELALGLPVSAPVPLAKGHPSRDYPFPWLVYPWLKGASLDRAFIEDWDVLAQEVGEFIIALGRRPTDGAPPPIRRGNPMAQYDPDVQWALRQLDDSVDVERAKQCGRTPWMQVSGPEIPSGSMVISCPETFW